MFRYHWQNLDDDRVGNHIGTGILAGRAWLNWYGKREYGARIAWYFGNRSNHCGAGITVLSDDSDCGFHICIPYLFSIYIAAILLPAKLVHKYFKTATYGYDLDFSIHDQKMWINLFRDDLAGWGNEPWWKSRMIILCPVDWLLGHDKYSTRDMDHICVEVAMPEKTYKGVVKIFESTWKRPRWPFKTRLVRTDLKLEEGIPVPGKGENSWDCGENCVYSQTSHSKTAAEAIASMIESALKTREKYGGLNWKPSGKVFVNRSYGRT